MRNAAIVTGGDDIYCGDQCRIVPARLGECLLASFAKHERASRRISINEQPFHTSAVTFTFSSSLSDLAGALNSDGAKYRGVDELIDQAELKRLLRTDLLTGEYHVERAGEPDSSR